MSVSPHPSLTHFPCGERIERGLADHAAGRKSIDACLVRIARPRLVEAGWMPAREGFDLTAEHDLYTLLGQEEGDPYSRYNAPLRELVSFERALDHEFSRIAAK
jgi:hypothetical protein